MMRKTKFDEALHFGFLRVRSGLSITPTMAQLRDPYLVTQLLQSYFVGFCTTGSAISPGHTPEPGLFS